MNTLRVILLSTVTAFTVACASTPSKPVTPTAPPAANIAGNWLLLVESPMGKQNVLMNVEQSGKEFKGRMESSVGTVDFTGKACTANTASWLYDTYALSNGLVRSLVANKLDTFFIIAVDYAFGQSMTNDVTQAAQAAGGKVLGVVKFPLNSADFASYLLQAQSSGAKVILLASGGADLINLIKQSREFGITQRQAVVTPLMFLTDVKGLGLDAAGGMRFSTAFYWDRNDETRAWAQRFREKHGAPPTMVHAAIYSSIRHYLKAIKAAGTDEAQAVMKKMREMPVDDMYVHGGVLREDGRLLHPMYLVEVKRPNESRGDWDFYKVVSTIPAEEAFQSAKDGGCPLAK